MEKTPFNLYIAVLVALLCALAPLARTSASVSLGQANVTSLSKGLVGYWPLDGATTNWSTGITRDLSGQGTDGRLLNTSTTTTPAVGKVGQALKTNGTNSYIDLGSGSAVKPTAALTVSIWLYKSAWTGGAAEATMSTTDSAGYEFYRNVGTSKMEFYAYRNSQYANPGVLLSTLTPGWHHFTGTFDGRYTRLYVDGVLKDTNDAGATYAITYIGNNLFIGAEASTNATPQAGFYWSGPQDEARIYNRALSPTEVALLYASGQANVGHANSVALKSGLTAYWPLDGSANNWTTNTTRDLSGQGNTGTFVSMSTSTSPVAGKIGGGLKFDGASQKITTGKAVNTLCSTSLCTLSVWIYPTGAVSNVSNTFTGQGIFGDDAGNMGIYRAQIAGVDRIRVYNWDANEDRVDIPFTVNKWIHVVWVHSGGILTAYANGVLVGSVASGTETGSGNISLGRGWTDATSKYFSGSLDEARVYNRALTPTEVAQLYAEGSANVAHSNTVSNSSGLVGYWTMDGSNMNWTTNQVSDSSGQGNAGQLISIATSTGTSGPIAGKIGQALKFNGGTSYVTVPYTATLAPTSGITFGGWFKTSDKTLNTRILSKTESGGYNLSFNDCAADSLTGVVRQGVTYYCVAYPTSNLSNNVWYHAIVTYDRETVRLYVNGTLVDSNTTPSGDITYSSSNAFCIGTEPGTTVCGVGQFFPGAIDDVRVYNRALSAQEVSQLYQTGR